MATHGNWVLADKAKLEGISEQQGAPETRRIGPPLCGYALTPVNPCPNYGRALKNQGPGSLLQPEWGTGRHGSPTPPGLSHRGEDSATGKCTPPMALKNFLAQVSTSDHGEVPGPYSVLKSGGDGVLANELDTTPIGPFHYRGRNKNKNYGRKSRKSCNLRLECNVRTLLDSYGSSDRPHRRTALVAAELSRYNIDIAALSETRILDEGSLTEEGMGYTFFWKGYLSGGQHLHGVGLAIKNTLLPRLAETPVGISERLITLRIPLVTNRFATLLSAYAPTLPSESEAKDSFYQSLDEALRRIPKNDKIFLLGDFNARVGQNSSIWSGVLGRHGVGQVNANGLRLLTLCSEHNLTITNTIFQQKAKYKTSWMHPRSKHWHLIDYVIVRRSDIRDVHITRAMRGAECWTDHRLIMAKVHMQVRPPLRLQGPRRRRLDCTRLENPDARNEFRCSLAEKLGGIELSLSSSENTMDQKWNSISSALYEAAAQTIGYKSKNHQNWFDENSEIIHDLLKDMHRAHQATLKSPSSSSTRQQWQRIRREVQRATRVMQNEWWTKKAHEIQSFADKNDMHNFYNAVKKIYGPISRCITPLKTADGLTVLKDQHSILLRWAEHFGTLLNQDSDADPTILDDLPTLPPMHNLDQPPTFLETNCRSIEATITQHQLRWLGHVVLVRMPSNRLPRRVLYGQLHHGRRSAGGQKKRYKDQLKTALKKCKIRPEVLEDAAADRNTWRQLCRDGTQMLEEERTARRQERRLRRNTPTVAVATTTTYTCPTCNRICGSRIGLFSHQRTHR
ncbi:hypothetical protein JOQ06_023050 [Pogonophryne albipinna]|uniref:C2H2-type domain-containing protein n=1 Tax=Pogonophryne albipinna TaxID=1090488 RepID=A0AAD6F1U4_9TELE|nr:hypothetical protein JOQ06_023050 [Pogonophryne albipinna]